MVCTGTLYSSGFSLNLLTIYRLHTIPEGFVILAGHSLGGFLTADAAIEGTRIRALRQRIVGMIAFDVPFLGVFSILVRI